MMVVVGLMVLGIIFVLSLTDIKIITGHKEQRQAKN